MEYKKYKSFDELDLGKLVDLLETGFGKKLVDDYFSYAHPNYICIAEDGGKYHGAIVVEEFAPGCMYLDKIVVAPESRGNGIKDDLWAVLNGDGAKVLWRAKPDNVMTQFYTGQMEGMQKVDGWVIYWKGLTPDEIAAGIKYAIAKKATMGDHNNSTSTSVAS